MNNQESIGVHIQHCNQGDYLGSCKYGDKDCPAKLNPIAQEVLEALEYYEECDSNSKLAKKVNEIEKTSMDTSKLARLIRLIVIKQWFHSIFALANTNRPDGMFKDDNDQAVGEIQKIAWDRYCSR